jgi:hypothetical protein
LHHKENSWKHHWAHKAFKWQFSITIVLLLMIAVFISEVFAYIEQRKGYLLNDTLLESIAATDLSVYIFILIYSAVLIALIKLLSDPPLLLKGLQAFAILLLLRTIVLYLVPLDPPNGIIPLQDPFVQYFFYNKTVVTKDLFFSGHISTLLLLVFLMKGTLRYLCLAISLITALCILVQHAHYTIDIIAAPLFAWLSYRLAKKIPLQLNTYI